MFSKAPEVWEWFFFFLAPFNFCIQQTNRDMSYSLHKSLNEDFGKGEGGKTVKREVRYELTPTCFQDEKALLIPEKSTENWKEGTKQDSIVCTELFTNVMTWGQNHMLGKT